MLTDWLSRYVVAYSAEGVDSRRRPLMETRNRYGGGTAQLVLEQFVSLTSVFSSQLWLLKNAASRERPAARATPSGHLELQGGMVGERRAHQDQEFWGPAVGAVAQKL